MQEGSSSYCKGSPRSFPTKPIDQSCTIVYRVINQYIYTIYRHDFKAQVDRPSSTTHPERACTSTRPRVLRISSEQHAVVLAISRSKNQSRLTKLLPCFVLEPLIEYNMAMGKEKDEEHLGGSPFHLQACLAIVSFRPYYSLFLGFSISLSRAHLTQKVQVEMSST